MQIWMARHAEAADVDGFGSDAARPLTERGRQQTAELARWLRDRVALPEMIWHSPLLRARQTAEAFAAEWPDGPPIQESQVLAPGMSLSEVLEAIRSRTYESILCVGHQPDVGECVYQAGGGRVSYSPGTVACLEFSQLLLPGAARLRWLSDPNWFA